MGYDLVRCLNKTLHYGKLHKGASRSFIMKRVKVVEPATFNADEKGPGVLLQVLRMMLWLDPLLVRRLFDCKALLELAAGGINVVSA